MRQRDNEKSGRLDWKLIHESNLIQGLLQVSCALIFTILFPLISECSKSHYQNNLELFKSKQNTFINFCQSFSFTISLHEEIRKCRKIVACENNKVYEASCKDILSKGTLTLFSIKEPFEATCKLAMTHFPGKISKNIDKLNKDMQDLMLISHQECNKVDSKNDKLLETISQEYNAIVDGMSKNLQEFSKRL